MSLFTTWHPSGFPFDPHVWGCFNVPSEMLEALPICGLCSRALHPQADDLRARCAALGWELRVIGVGYELRGNGEPAAFSSEESLVVWLERQEKHEAA